MTDTTFKTNQAINKMINRKKEKREVGEPMRLYSFYCPTILMEYIDKYFAHQGFVNRSDYLRALIRDEVKDIKRLIEEGMIKDD